MVNAFKLFIILFAASTSAKVCTCKGTGVGDYCGTREKLHSYYLVGDCDREKVYHCPRSFIKAVSKTLCSSGCVEAPKAGEDKCND